MQRNDPHKQETIAAEPISLESQGSFPHQIGPYLIESLLVEGGMSHIYLARHPASEEKIIVKVVQPRFLKNKEMISRLLTEAKILQIASHPGIVKLYDLGRFEGGVFLAMEYVEGVPLRQLIHKESFNHRRALELLLQIGSAVEHLHSHGIIHRDLKPDNILVTQSGDVKLIDFGISQFLQEKVGEIVRAGTPGYMSPEQKEHPEKVSFGADIYSLGLIAYELYLGKLSYGIIYPALLPQGLRKVIEKALETNVEHRYQKVSQFLAGISYFLEHEEVVEPEEEALFVEKQKEEIRKLLIPLKTHHVAEAEIGIACHFDDSIDLPLLDFFSLPDHGLAIILAKVKTSALAPALSMISFRAMIRAFVRSMHPFDSARLMEKLNEELIAQKIEVSCSLLVLHPGEDRLFFLNCGSGFLMELAFDGAEPNLFNNETHSLGVSSDFTVVKGEENWPIGSTLIFSLEKVDSLEMAQDYLLAPEPLAQEIVRKMAFSNSPVLAIRRV